MDEQISIYVDGAGRYVLGIEIASDDANSIRIKNPALIVINTGANGQVQIQTIPFFFKELTAPGCNTCIWDFPKNNCTRATSIQLSEQLKKQYYNAVNPPQTPPQQVGEQVKTVKLFDE